MTAFGVAHFFRADFRRKPGLAIQVVRALEAGVSGESVRFHGLPPDSDHFSPLRQSTSQNLARLEASIADGAYASLVALKGDRNEPSAQLSLELASSNADASTFSQSVEYTCKCASPADVAYAENVSLDLWRLLSPGYGFSVLGQTEVSVLQELSAVPIADWRQPPDETTVKRLGRLQSLRPEFGRVARGAGWGTFLGSALVTQLGGSAKIEGTAPVFAVRRLSGDSVYLRLSSAELTLDSPEYLKAAGALERFMAPVIPPALRC